MVNFLVGNKLKGEVLVCDRFESAPLSTLWKQSAGVSVENAPGADGAAGFVRLSPGNGMLKGLLSEKAPNGLVNFYIEFFLRPANEREGQFNLRILNSTNDGVSTSVIYDSSQGWTIDSAGESHALPELKRIALNAWSRLRFTGRNWGSAGACCNLALFDAQGRSLGATPADRNYLRGDPRAAMGLLVISGGRAGWDVDEISVGRIDAYAGPSVRGVDVSTLQGKVMCGYQGWFGVPGDGGAEGRWGHWTKDEGPLADGNAHVDLWPDVSELEASQRFSTGFKMKDGRPAEVFSSLKKQTVVQHFKWMKDYGLDGVFVQRFAVELGNPARLDRCNTVLANCREGANTQGRAYAVMYDLSGLRHGRIGEVMNDWKSLRREMAITDDGAYLYHHGKPLVAVWGVGFNDERDYTLEECRQLVEFLKHDPEAGGCTVMLGVPTYWRELKRDAVDDAELIKIAAMADVISPWTVGRYTTPDAAAVYAKNVMAPDIVWCKDRGVDFLPVVFPGFSWHNMKSGPLNQIPRLRGEFLWSQFREARRAKASMAYVAMFDEVDEGTAIFKCVNEPPVSQRSKFLTYEGLPSDYYLKLVGAGTRLIRGEISADGKPPILRTTQEGASNAR